MSRQPNIHAPLAGTFDEVLGAVANENRPKEKTYPAKPFLKWVGGKRSVLPILLERLPKDYSTYHEPFIGGGALFFAVQPDAATLSDVNLHLVLAYIAIRGVVEGKQYAKHILVGPTIYETSRYVDFLIINTSKWPDGLIIECKWQQSGGSVDEKYPFLMFNIARTAVPTIVLLDGGGYKPAAKKWLEGQAGKERSLRAVWSMSDFQREVNNGFLG